MITARHLVGPIVSAALSFAACTEGGDPLDPSPGACTAPSSLCVRLEVPATYAGTPKKIIAGLFESLPPIGPPNGVAAIAENPVIAPATPFELEALDVMPSGDWYVYIVLYDVAGGNFQPVENVDYVVESSSKVSIGDTPVNMPPMELALYTGE